jgi:hypothetical protein
MKSKNGGNPEIKKKEKEITYLKLLKDTSLLKSEKLIKVTNFESTILDITKKNGIWNKAYKNKYIKIELQLLKLQIKQNNKKPSWLIDVYPKNLFIFTCCKAPSKPSETLKKETKNKKIEKYWEL